MKKLKIYIAGPYNGRNVIEVIENIHHGLLLNSAIKWMGFRTYCPWSDFLEALFLPGRPAIEWKGDALEELLECNALVLADDNPRWQDSKGTIDELATCVQNDMPIFLESDLLELAVWASKKNMDNRMYSYLDQEDNGEID